MGLLGKFFGGKPAPASAWDEQTKLIHWKGERGSADWTIGDSFEGVQVFGDTGSGKSSASAKLLASALLRAGYGGLVLTVKPEDAADWKKLLAENGRADDGIFFDPDGGRCFNFLQYEFDYGKSKPGLESLSAAQILSELVSLAQRGAGRESDFWSQSANELISHTLEIIRAAGETPSLRLAKELIESAPRSLADVDDSAWQMFSKMIKGRGCIYGSANIAASSGSTRILDVEIIFEGSNDVLVKMGSKIVKHIRAGIFH